MKRRSLYYFGILCIIFVASCQSGQQSDEVIKVLDCTQFEAQLNQAKAPYIFDVRTPDEYSNGLLHSAINMDYYADDFSEKVAGLDKKRPAFLYCAKGGRSHQAAEIFKEQGFTEVYDLDGGYDACGH